jgi:hypothetical protein
MPESVVEKRVDRTGVDRSLGKRGKRRAVCKIVRVQSHLDAFEHALNQRGVTRGRDALMGVVEIIVVVGKADRQAADDERRKFCAGSAPLFLRIPADQLFI